jgi:protein SCO1
MNKNTKTVLLTSLLIFPVLVFLFLKGCGSNHYTLPVYFAYDSTLVDGNYVVTDAHKIPEFSFINQEGEKFGSSDLKGKIFVADFFFTRCTGICLDMTTQLKRVQDAYKDNNDVSIISFTVDPRNDSSAILKNYASEYHIKSDKWNLITGNKDSIYTLAQKGFYLAAGENEEDPIDFIHSPKCMLVDKQGRIRGIYDGTDKEDVDRLITEIQILIYEYNKSTN